MATRRSPQEILDDKLITAKDREATAERLFEETHAQLDKRRIQVSLARIERRVIEEEQALLLGDGPEEVDEYSQGIVC